MKKLAAGEIVSLTKASWEKQAGGFTVVREVETGLAGALLIVEQDGLTAAVERPKEGRRVVRPLAGPGDAERFVAERMAAYDRLWDG